MMTLRTILEKSIFIATVCCFYFISGSAFGDDELQSARLFVKTYCISCHGTEAQEGDRTFANLLDVQSNGEADFEHWREILDRLNFGDMPPEDASEQPTDEQRVQIIEQLTDWMIEQSEAHSDSSDSVALRRLTRHEYDRSVRRMLGLENMLRDATAFFPADETKDGFSTIADTLIVSNFLLNQYLDAADAYLHEAIERCSENTKPQTWTFKAPFFKEGNVGDGLNKDGEYQHIRERTSGYGNFVWLAELKAGVPASGKYKVRIKAMPIDRNHPYKDWILDVPREDPLIMSVVAANASASKDPKTVHGTDRTLVEFELENDSPEWFESDVWIDKGYLLKLGFPNGPAKIKYRRHSLMSHHRELFPEFLRDHVPVFHDMHPDFDKDTAPEMVEAFLAEQDELKRQGKFYYVFGIDHPLHTNEAWRTFYREYRGPRIRVFEVQLSGPVLETPNDTVKPLLDAKLTDQQAIVAIKSLSEVAARRPVTEEESAVIVALYRSARKQKSVGESLRLAYKAVLCGPSFLYLRTSDGELDDFALATRLSYFLTGGPPDDLLLAAAAEGQLSKTSELKRQTDRLLDQKGVQDDFVDRFANAWLKLSKLGTMLPSFDEHPTYFNERLEQFMRRETVLFLSEMLENDRTVDWLINADHTFINAPLARLYGIKGVKGLEMKRMKIADSRRHGLLGHASVLTASANGIDTSPVLRGVWVLECILGTPPSPPPPDIEPLEPDIRGTVSIRSQLAKHRDVVSCNHCHRRIDPLGFALEPFDEIGRFRKEYGGWQEPKVPIDTSGKLPTGEKFDDIVGLRKLLTEQTDLIQKNLVTKLLVYATGRIDDHKDQATVLAICSRIADGNAEAQGNLRGMKTLLHEVIASDAFRR